MAGDWIPYELALPTKGEVRRIARDAGVSRFEVCGRLMAFWGWASTETADGVLRGIYLADLSDLVGFDEPFWRAVVAVGWLRERRDGLLIPNAERWITRAAKARLQKNRRQQQWRDGRGDSPDDTSGDAPVDAPVDAGESPPGDDHVDVSGASKAPTTEQYSTRRKNTSLTGFAEFWAAYPRKVDKADAERAWAKLAPNDALREQIMAGLAALTPQYLRRIERGEREYVPHASTWLHKRRWEDEPEPTGPEHRPAAERPFVC